MSAIGFLLIAGVASAAAYSVYKGVQVLKKNAKPKSDDDTKSWTIMGGICKAVIDIAKIALLIDVTTTVATAAQPVVEVVEVVVVEEPVPVAPVCTDNVVITNVIISGTRLDANIPVEPPVIANAINRMGHRGFDDLSPL